MPAPDQRPRLHFPEAGPDPDFLRQLLCTLGDLALSGQPVRLLLEVGAARVELSCAAPPSDATPPDEGQPADATTDEPRTRQRASPRCLADIEGVLGTSGQRLTGSAIKEALAAADKEWSSSTIDSTLAEAKRTGKLTHATDGPHKGYGLPSWGVEPPEWQRASPRCLADIIAVLGQADQRLNGSRIKEELSRAGKEWSGSTVDYTLADARRSGALSYGLDARGQAYGLPTWGTTEEVQP